MHIFPRRLLLSSLFATVIALAGCGGSDTTQESATSTAAKGGTSKPGSTSSASIVATPALVDRNAPLTFSLNPGSYAGQMVFIKWQCWQNGVLLAYDGSDELNNAVATGKAGYTAVGGNLDWTIIVSQATNDNLAAGVGANCDMQAWYVNKRWQWFQIASGTFDVSP